MTDKIYGFGRLRHPSTHISTHP